MRIIDGIDALPGLIGQDLGTSPWLPVTQDMVDRFADLTDDRQWIHVDPERARKESPWGATVAHGYLTLALIPRLVRQVFRVEGVATRVNYGLEKVRFPHPVVVGRRVRARVSLLSARLAGNGAMRVVAAVTVEVEGAEKPACIAETVTLFYP